MTDISYADLTDVQSRRAGDTPVVSDAWDDVITAKIAEISRDLDRMVGRARGSTGDFRIVAAADPTARSFYVPDGGCQVLAIDDCISIASASSSTIPATSTTTLVDGTDYRAVRSGGAVVALASLTGGWPAGARIDLSARWGLMAAVSVDLRETTIIETIRSFMGDRAGNDDVVGLSPFGAVTFSKAYASKSSKFVADHAYGGASLRGN